MEDGPTITHISFTPAGLIGVDSPTESRFVRRFKVALLGITAVLSLSGCRGEPTAPLGSDGAFRGVFRLVSVDGQPAPYYSP